MGEFAKYHVLPLDASAATRFVTPRPSPAAGREVFTYSGSTVSIPNGNQPSPAEISIPDDIDGWSLHLGMPGTATVFAPDAGVIGILMSVLVWVSSYAAL